MRTIILLSALALTSAAWAQEQKKEETKPAAQETVKPAPVAKKSQKSRRHQDARHCLQKGSNTEIIRCAEAYL